MNENLLKKLYKEINDFKDNYNNFIIPYANNYPKKVFVDSLSFRFDNYNSFKSEFSDNVDHFIENYIKSKDKAVSMFKSVGAYNETEISKFLYFDDNVKFFRTLKGLALKSIENKDLVSASNIQKEYKNNIINVFKNKFKKNNIKKEAYNGK